jgi:hypothetical protein
LATLFICCESESGQVRELRERIQKNARKLQNMGDNIQTLTSELIGTWGRSLKYRFPKVQAIVSEEVLLNLGKEGLPYLKSAQFQYKTNHELKLTCSYQTDQEKVRPQFVLYIFDQYGSNIHKEVIHYKPKYLVFGKDLVRGKLTRQDYKINVVSSTLPIFFMIAKVAEAAN